MGRARKFSKKIYCGNCGKWGMTIRLDTKEGWHANKVEITHNHEICESAGSGVRTYGFHDIYGKNRQQKTHEFTVNTAFAPKEVIEPAIKAP